MRIMYIIDSLKVGGAEMLLLAMLRSYAQDHELSVVYFTPGPLIEDVTAMGIPMTRISTKGMKDPMVIPHLVSFMRRTKPDVVHTHLSKSDVSGLMAAYIAGVPVRISSIHNVDPWREKGYLSAIMRQWMKTCHHMIAVSEGVREYVIKNSGYPADKITTIDNGIDLNRFNPQTVAPLNKADWGIEPDTVTVGMVARLEEQKGHHILIAAAHEVIREMPNVRFVIVGDGHLREGLERQRNQLGLQGKVVFTGILRDIPGVLATLDLIVFSSLWEGLPVALLEAMSMKKPIVSTAVGGIPNVIITGQNGLLVDKDNVMDLAQGIIKVLKDQSLAEQMAEAARKTIEERYSAEAMHQRILQMYEEYLH